MVPTDFAIGIDVGAGQAELLPIMREYGWDVFGVEGFVLVSEADPAGQLRVTGQLPVKAGHANQDHTQVGAVAELLETVHLQPVSLVNDE